MNRRVKKMYSVTVEKKCLIDLIVVAKTEQEAKHKAMAMQDEPTFQKARAGLMPLETGVHKFVSVRELENYFGAINK